MYFHNLLQELQHLVCLPVKEPQNELKKWYVSMVVFIYKRARASRSSTVEHLLVLIGDRRISTASTGQLSLN
jgi:hypothetical protein